MALRPGGHRCFGGLFTFGGDAGEDEILDHLAAEVAIHFEGEPIGVRDGGVFSPARTHVLVEALPTEIPGSIELDISGVELGESLRVADLPELEGVTYLDDPEAVIMSITTPAAEVEEEVEEGEEVADAEGEAPEGEEATDETAEEAGEEGEEG